MKPTSKSENFYLKESYQHVTESSKDWKYYNDIDIDTLRQIDAEEAKHALGELSEYDDVLQRHNFAFTDPEQRSKIDAVRGRMKILRDIIDPPPPPPSAEEREQRKQAREERYAKEAEIRRQIQPTKQKMREQGVFEKIGSMLPEWAHQKNQTSFGPMPQPGDGGVPPVVQKYVALKFLQDGEMPQMDWITGFLLDRLVQSQDLSKNHHMG